MYDAIFFEGKICERKLKIFFLTTFLINVAAWNKPVQTLTYATVFLGLTQYEATIFKYGRNS